MSKNIDLMLQVRNAVTANPECHAQRTWSEAPDKTAEEAVECGTTMCMAGWAIAIATRKSVAQAQHDAGKYSEIARCHMPASPGRLAADLMGLTDAEATGEDGDSGLFYTMDEEEAIKILDRLIEEGKNDG